MRDIKPAKRPRHVEDEEIELFEASTSTKQITPRPAREKSSTEASAGPRRVKKRDRFRGSTVPVTNIPVPHEPSTVHADHNHGSGSSRSEKLPLRAAASKKKEKPAKAAPPKARMGNSERKILLFVFLLVGIAGVIGAFIFLPTATVVLHLRTAPLLVDEELRVASNPGAGAHIVPGTVFFREVSTTGSVPVEHRETIGSKAGGAVQIINQSTQEQAIREQSRLVTSDGVLFYMQQHLIIPPNSSATVQVEAAEAGEAGNIEPQRLNFAALDESSQSILYAEATTTLSGGTGETIAVVSDDDIVAAQKNAGERARSQVETEIRNELPAGWIVLEESWSGVLDSFEADRAVGDAVPELGYTAQVSIRVLALEQELLLSRLRVTLDAQLDDEFMLFPGPISYTKSVKNVDWSAEEASLAVRVTHTTIPALNLDTLREKLAARSVTEAQSYLEGLPGVRSAEIALWPFWAASIPRIESRIALQLEPERQP